MASDRHSLYLSNRICGIRDLSVVVKMMGRGAEGGGCCSQGSSCMVEKLMKDGESSDKNIIVCQKQMRRIPIDGFNQALKALAVKLPFLAEDGSGSGSVPAAFTGFLANNPKGGDHKRKYKKLHNKRRDGGDGNNSGRSNQGKGFNSSQIWCEMEEYFREVTAEDIKVLLPKTQIQTSESSDVHDSCLLIPSVGINYRQLRSERDGVDADHNRADAEQAVADLVLPRQKSISGLKQKPLSTSLHKGNKITHSAGEVLTIIPPSQNGDDKLCDVCNHRDIEEGNRIISCDVCHVMVHQRCYGVQQMPEARWLCSWCSYKFYSSFVSSNRAASVSGNYECHQPSDAEGNDAKACILCPRTTGALKPVMKMTEDSKKPGNLQFAHVSCCHWMPETYIEDIEMMEPIKNVEGVAKEKWTLLCSLCKENHGACIKCSHGTCDTAFHPLCAKEANLQMEISGKEGSESVELSAFCPKHSLPHTIRALSAKNMSVAITSEEAGQELFKSRVLFHSCEENWVEHEQQLTEAKSGDQSKGGNMFSMEKKDWQVSGQRVCLEDYTGEEDSHLKSRDQSSFYWNNSMDTLFGSTVQVEMDDILEEVDSVGFSAVGQRNNLDVTNNGVLHMPESEESSVAVEVGSTCSIIEKLRKAVQQMQATLDDVAVAMGVSSDVLTTLLQGNKCAVSSDLQRRISRWLNSYYLPSNVVCQSESTYKHENSLGVEISNLDSSKERFIHAQRFNGKLESLRSLNKELPSSREYKSVDTISSRCKESDDDDVAMDDSFTQHILSHGIELDIPVKLVSGKNHIKMMAQSFELDRQNENPTADILKLRASQGEHISNSFLKDLEIDSMNSIVDEMVSLNLSLDLGAKHFDEERQKRGLSKDASTSHSCCAIELCDVGASRNLQTSKLKEWRKSVEFTPKQNSQSTSDTRLNKDSPDGIEKDSQFGHTSSKAESMEVSDCKELCQLGNHVERASIHCNESLQEFSIDATPVTNAHLNVDGHHVESYNRNFISMETLNVQTDVDCGREAPQFYAPQFIPNKLVQHQHGSAFSKGYGSPHTAVRDHWERDMATEENQFEDAQVMKHEKHPATILSTVANDSVDFQWKQLQEARDKGILDCVPENDMEAELMYLQNALLDYTLANCHHCENLILRVITNLSEEQQASRRQRWDIILVNHYLNQVNEARKQSRKDRRHKESQNVLPAATASRRFGSTRTFASGGPVNECVTGQAKHKLNVTGFADQSSVPNDGSHNKVGLPSLYPISQPMKLSFRKPLKMNIGGGPPSFSQTLLCNDETPSRHAWMNAFTTSQNDAYQSLSELQKLELLLCDICSSQEYTGSNKIYACHRCKIAVHQDCYGIFSVPSSGRWYCQPCLAIKQQYQDRRLPDVVSRGRPEYHVLCALCGGLSGAFKRSTDGLWVHVFCAEWMPETTVGKCQVDPVYGLHAVVRERYTLTCCICHRHQGACLMCNFSHCNNAFHPLCARDFGLFMSVKTGGGGKNEHIAYCQEHTSHQMEKAESEQCGSSEGLIYIKQARVELERVRLICERIVRREKLKRELLHCSHNILASKRDCIAYSAVFHSSFLPPADMVSMSAIPQFGNAEFNKACHDRDTRIFQMSNACPVESSESGKFGGVIAAQSEVLDLLSVGHDGAAQFGRISNRGVSLGTESASYLTRSTAINFSRNEQHRKPKKSRKHAETLPREAVMTPTEASMQNRRLPKGYAYVPVGCLTKGKSATQDAKPQDF